MVRDRVRCCRRCATARCPDMERGKWLLLLRVAVATELLFFIFSFVVFLSARVCVGEVFSRAKKP